MDPLSIETIGGGKQKILSATLTGWKATGNKKRQVACKTDHLLPFGMFSQSQPGCGERA